MKGQNDMLKNKSFYIWMLSGALVVVCMCAVCLNIGNLNDKETNPKLNNQVAENTVESPQPTEEIGDAEVAGKNVTVQENLLENDIVEDVTAKEVAKKKETSKKADTKADTKTVMANSRAVLNSLEFDEEAGLAWPVSGNVVLEFSDERAIYFPTLENYRCNPAIVISAEEGTKVESAAKGVITKVFNNEETGLTVEMAIGNDYSLTYGQLKDLTVKKGDTVQAGQVLGKIAKPTNYYVIEGSNLYFKVTQKEKAVNPMYLLK